MGILSARPLTLLALLSFTSLSLGSCGGRAITQGNDSVDGSAGSQSFAGAAQSVAGAQGVAGSAQSVAGTSAGGSKSLTQCNQNEDCTILAKGCCGTFEPVTEAQLVSVNRAQAAEYQASQCPEPPPCPSSPPSTEYDETQKYFRAVCLSTQTPDGAAHGSCAILDVRGSSYTRCVTASECTLRDGVDCCAGCDGQDWVPVRSDANFCSAPMSCPHCVSLPPIDLRATCQAGMCRFLPPLR
ncbi:MAG: hypothetical protein ABW061_10150 [Polyangiaceae bacterium]